MLMAMGVKADLEQRWLEQASVAGPHVIVADYDDGCCKSKELSKVYGFSFSRKIFSTSFHVRTFTQYLGLGFVHRSAPPVFLELPRANRERQIEDGGLELPPKMANRKTERWRFGTASKEWPTKISKMAL